MMSDKPIPEPGGPRAPARLSGSDRRRGEAAVGSHLVAMPDAVVDPSRWFGDDHPVELEIGCGKGAFLVAAAEMFPGVNFVGVEVAAAFARAAAARMARRRLSNVRIVAADAGRLVGERLRSESLNAVHVYFPDPWPNSAAPGWQLRGMAVLPELRGEGVGRKLLKAVHEEVSAPLWCNAREAAEGFYNGEGYGMAKALREGAATGQFIVVDEMPDADWQAAVAASSQRSFD